MNSIKKVLTGIGTFFVTLFTNFFVAVNAELPQAFYGIPDPEPTAGEKIWKFAKPLIIPVILVIGLIAFLKRSKSDKTFKIVVSILAIVLAVLLWYLVSMNT